MQPPWRTWHPTRGAWRTRRSPPGWRAPDDPDAVAAEARWQQGHLTPEASAILAELPAPPRSGGTLSALQQDLHAYVLRRG